MEKNAYNVVIVSAPQMDGNISYSYDMEGVMRIMENNMQTKELHILAFFQTHCPLKETLLDKFVKIAREKVKLKLHVNHVPIDLSFENFWNIYNYKNGRMKAETEWNKLTDVDKTLVFQSLPKYNFYMQTHKNQDKVWAERYLKHKRYKDAL